MVHLSANDFYEVQASSLLSELDTQALVMLYQPFIGVEAIASYLTLKQRLLFQDITGIETIQQLLILLDLNLTQFHHARLRLEGVGLIQTTRVSIGDAFQYRFDLFAPKTVHAFFDDPLLSGMLRLAIGDKRMDHIQQMYAKTPLDGTSENVSASFGEVFHPDLNHPAFLHVSNRALLGRQSASSRRTFDIENLKQHLLQQDISVSILESQWTTLSDYATLYGLDELALAELLLSERVLNLMTGVINYDELGRLAALEKRLPFVRKRQQAKRLEETSDKAVQVNLMETLSPLDYLRLKQHGADPSSPDVKLITDLYFSQQLPHPVINALVDYVLTTQDNTLSRAYTLKLAASLSREKLEHAIDTLDYFTKVAQKGMKAPKSSKRPTNSPSQEQPVSQEELEDLAEQMKAFK
jgi:replication initiation and membrane attachment protein